MAMLFFTFVIRSAHHARRQPRDMPPTCELGGRCIPTPAAPGFTRQYRRWQAGRDPSGLLAKDALITVITGPIYHPFITGRHHIGREIAPRKCAPPHARIAPWVAAAAKPVSGCGQPALGSRSVI